MKTLSEIRLKDADRQMIDDAVHILRQKFPVKRIVLFGSKARGDDDEYSDIDLLILVDSSAPADIDRKIFDELQPMEHERLKWFGLIVRTEEEWYHGISQALPIRHEIDREGVEIL
jgi:predicted nucleotidyltransferase